MLLPEKGYKRILVIACYTVLIAISAFLFFKYLFSPLLSFITAFLIVSATRPAVTYLYKKLGLSKKFTAIMFTVILISLLSMIIYFSVSRLLYELAQLIKFYSSGAFTELLNKISANLDSFLVRLSGGGFAKELFTKIATKGKLIETLATNAVNELMPTVMQKLMAFLSFFPSALIFIVLMFISMFYIGCDYESIIAFFSAQLSPKAKNTVFEIKKQFQSVCSELFKAYFLITLITFAELLTGFFILDIKYAVILAIIIAFVDMLPVLGTGTVLVPWGIICLVLGDSKRAIGLLVLYGTLTVVRQIIEPKIVGASIGLYPLVTLISMYCGLKIIGFPGIFVFPIAAMIIKSLNDKGIIKLFKMPTPSQEQKLAQSKKKFADLKKRDKNT